jgi:PAS domain S-box-containing protein
MTALEAVRRRAPDLLLAGAALSTLDGRPLAIAIRDDPALRDLPIVLVAADGDEKRRLDLLPSGADGLLAESFSALELMTRIAAAMALARQRRARADHLRRSQATLLVACDLVGVAAYLWNPETNQLTWDARAKAMWALPPDTEPTYDLWRDAIHPDDRARVEAAVAACADPAGDGVYDVEYRVIGIEDQVERWIATQGRTVFESGRAVDFIGAAVDITDRKRAERALTDSERRFRLFAEYSSNVIWMLDVRTGTVEYGNPALERLWGVPGVAALPTIEAWLATVHQEDRADAEAMFDRVRNEGLPASREFRIVRPDGAVRWVLNVAFPIRDERGRVATIGGIAQDITRDDAGALVYLVDGDEAFSEQTSRTLWNGGLRVKAFASGRGFLDVASALSPGCVVLDIRSPRSGGLMVCRELRRRQVRLPVIVMGDFKGDVKGAVHAMKAGADDVLDAPVLDETILAAVASSLAVAGGRAERDHAAADARRRLGDLSPREREVLSGLLAGGTNKTIARELGISPRTVESHRAHVMERLGAQTLSELVMTAAAAGLKLDPPPPRSASPY